MKAAACPEYGPYRNIKPVEVCGNDNLPMRKIENILDNAIKFSPEGETVLVELPEKPTCL